MKSFKEFNQFILEGGNVQIGDKSADRINLKNINRDDIIPVIKNGLKAISDQFENKNGLPLWDSEVFKSNKFLSGSAFHFFDVMIPSTEFVSKKPSVGDIDTMVDVALAPMVKEFLSANIGKSFDKLNYIGFKESAGQFITLWELSEFNINIQIDLELVDHDNGKPTDWAQFSHSSAWSDIVNGVKGVHHKYLMQSLSADVKEPIIILTGKRRTPKETDKSKLAFSVQKGLRIRYVPHLVDGKQQLIGGKLVFDELETNESVFETKLENIFTMFIGSKPTGSDMSDMHSFNGSIKILKKYKKPNEIKLIFDDYFDRLFGKGAQMIVRADHTGDLSEKFPGIIFATNELSIDIEPYNKKIAEYYKGQK